jgi:hypothetical protein
VQVLRSAGVLDELSAGRSAGVLDELSAGWGAGVLDELSAGRSVAINSSIPATWRVEPALYSWQEPRRPPAIDATRSARGRQLLSRELRDPRGCSQGGGEHDMIKGGELKEQEQGCD